MDWLSREHKLLPEFRIDSGFLFEFETVFKIDFDSFSEFSVGDSIIKFSKILGLGCSSSFTKKSGVDFSELKEWLSQQGDLVFGFLSYDLKNEIEDLKSVNPDSVGFPLLNFVVPEHILIFTERGWECYSHGEFSGKHCIHFEKAVLGNAINVLTKPDYVHQVENLKQYIQFGDIYEVNYCMQHGFKDSTLNPHQLYDELQAASPAPFSCFVSHDGKYLMSSSPERFIKKEGARLISQPIKGTNRRVGDNESQKELLRANEKEVAENVMITDLVRNDLSKSAKRGSVRVDELCGIYEFQHVNQMISTVSAEIKEDVHPLDAILNAFPMGSMTGAPKIRAMELIDQFEDFSRGLYSGAVGYFTPELDFDFNVVIRSILYNEERKVVTFPTGGAITINSDPEKEYEECLLKAEAMRKVLLNHAK